ATVDLRGEENLPELLQIVGNDRRLRKPVSILQRWLNSGAHRIDENHDGQYEHQSAVALMDAWWDPLIHAMFDGQLKHLYWSVPITFDDENRTLGLGSSFQGGYYGYVDKTLRLALGDHVLGSYRILRCADGT